MAISSKRVESLLSEARVAIKNAGESPWIDKKFYIAQVGAWSPLPLFLFWARGTGGGNRGHVIEVTRVIFLFFEKFRYVCYLVVLSSSSALNLRKYSSIP